MAITTAMRDQVAQLYVALFGRAPESDGLGYWVSQLDSGRTFAQVAQSMYDVEPARAYYPLFLTNSEIVSRFYTNVLGRTPTQADIDYWAGKLDAGLTKGQVISEMITAVVNYSGTDAAALDSKSLFTNKVDVGLYYAVTLSGNSVTTASTALTGVTKDATSVTTAKAALDSVGGVTKALTTGATDTVTGTQFNDTFIGQAGQSTTLQASDNIAGGAGNDTLRVVTDTATAQTVTGFTVTGVEVLEVQAQTVGVGTTLGLENVSSDLTTIRSSSSSDALTVNNVGKLVGLELNNTLAASNVTISYKDSVVAGTADTQSVKLSGNSIGTLKVGGTTAPTNTGIETIAITTSGSASTITTLDSTAATITGAGDQGLTITNALNAAVTSVDGSTMTGALKATLGVAASNVTVKGGSAADTLDASNNTGKVNISGGAGNDTISLANAADRFTSDDTVAGGDGTDSLKVADLAHANTKDDFKNVTSIEKLTITGAATAATLVGVDSTTDTTNGTGANAAGVATYEFAGGLAGNVTLSKISATNIELNSTLGGFNLTATADSDTSSNTLTIKDSLNANQTLGTVTASDAETLTLNVDDTDTTTVETLTVTTLTAADLTTLNLMGDANLTVTNTISSAALATVAGSTATGNLLFNVASSADSTAATKVNVSVTTGSGNDNFDVGSGATFGSYTVVGGAGNDDITIVNNASATAATHNIDGGAGNDTITMTGTYGNNTVVGGDGNDTITMNGAAAAGFGADNISGGAGNDTINAGNGNDTVSGGDGDDSITVGVGVVSVDGGAGNDTFTFTGAVTELTSADTIVGGDGTADKLVVQSAGSIGDAAFNNWTGVEQMTLAAGSTLTMNAIANAKSFDTVNLSTGANVVTLAEGFTRSLTVNLSTGTDKVDGTTAPGTLTVKANVASVTAADTIIGGTGTSDSLVLTADNGTATLSSVSAVETVTISAGTAGTETASVTLGADTVIAANKTLTVSASALGSSATFTYDGSAVTTATKTQNITGGSAADAIYAGAGNDVISGGSGTDTLQGNGGADSLTGGSGADTFFYNALADSSGSTVDTIADFTSGTDVIRINSSLLNGTVVPTSVVFAGNADNFGAAQGLTKNGNADAEAVFDKATSTLWIDVNNDGALNADDVQIKLTGVTALVTADVTSGLGANAFVQDNNQVITGTLSNDTVSVLTVNPTVTSDLSGGINTVVLNSTGINISGATYNATGGSVVYSLSSGFNATMTAAQFGSLTSAAGTNNVTLSAASTSITANTAVETLTLASGANTVSGITGAIAVTGAAGGGITTANVTGTYTGTLTGQGGDDILGLANGANISGATVGADFVTLNVTAGASVTMTTAQHGAFTTAITGTGTETITLTTATAGLTGDADIESYVLSTNNDDFVINAVGQSVSTSTGVNALSSAAGVDALTGTITGAGTTTFTLDDADDLSGATVTGITTYAFNGAGAAVTLDEANLSGVSTNVTGGAGADSLTLSKTGAGTYNFSALAMTAVETLVLSDAANGAIAVTADAADVADVATITGDAGGGVNSLALNDATNLSAKTITNLDTVTIAGANQTLTLDDDDMTASNFTTVTGSGTSNLVLSDVAANDGAIDLTNTTISGFDTITTDNGNSAITFDAASLSNAIAVTLVGDATTDLTFTEDYNASNWTLTAGDFNVVTLNSGVDLTVSQNFLSNTVTDVIGAGGTETFSVVASAATSNIDISNIATVTNLETLAITDGSGANTITLAGDAVRNITTVTLTNGASDTIVMSNAAVNGTQANEATITGFTTGITAEADIIDLPTYAAYVVATANTALAANAANTVVEVTSANFTISNFTDVADAASVEAAIVSALDMTALTNGDDIWVVIYGAGANSGKAALYQVDVTTAASETIAVELVGVFNGVTADSFVNSNFA